MPYLLLFKGCEPVLKALQNLFESIENNNLYDDDDDEDDIDEDDDDSPIIPRDGAGIR